MEHLTVVLEITCEREKILVNNEFCYPINFFEKSSMIQNYDKLYFCSLNLINYVFDCTKILQVSDLVHFWFVC